jgi:hypothetical protein
MLKLNAGFSRKVGEPNYGSRGASVNVELEVESGLIADPDALMTRVRNLFTIAKRSVGAELGSAAPNSNTAARPKSRDPARSTGGAPRTSGNSRGGATGWSAQTSSVTIELRANRYPAINLVGGILGGGPPDRHHLREVVDSSSVRPIRCNSLSMRELHSCVSGPCS